MFVGFNWTLIQFSFLPLFLHNHLHSQWKILAESTLGALCWLLRFWQLSSLAKWGWDRNQGRRVWPRDVCEASLTRFNWERRRALSPQVCLKVLGGTVMSYTRIAAGLTCAPRRMSCCSHSASSSGLSASDQKSLKRLYSPPVFHHWVPRRWLE